MSTFYAKIFLKNEPAVILRNPRIIGGTKELLVGDVVDRFGEPVPLVEDGKRFDEPVSVLSLKKVKSYRPLHFTGRTGKNQLVPAPTVKQNPLAKSGLCMSVLRARRHQV